MLFGKVSGNFPQILSHFYRYRKIFENFLLPFSHLPTLWSEGKVITTKTTDGRVISTFKIILPHTIEPEFFAKYIKSIYDKSITLTDKNCAKFYQVIDFFEDTKTLSIVTEFIKKNISFENSFHLMNMTSIFNSEIEEWYKTENRAQKFFDMQEQSTINKSTLPTNGLSLEVFTKFIRILDRCQMDNFSILKIIAKRILSHPTEVIDILVLLEGVFKQYDQKEKDYLYHHCMISVNRYNAEMEEDKNIDNQISAASIVSIYGMIHWKNRPIRQ